MHDLTRVDTEYVSDLAGGNRTWLSKIPSRFVRFGEEEDDYGEIGDAFLRLAYLLPLSCGG